MAYLTAADFRAGTLKEYTFDLQLRAEDVEDDDLITAAIAALSERFDNWAGDHFEPETITEDLDVWRYNHRLYLPRRIRSITSVSTIDDQGVVTLQSATAYRMRSSLDATGTDRTGSADYLELLDDSVGLTSTPYGYVWPIGAKTVRIVGSFGWAAPPRDVKRAVAVMVYDHFKPVRADLRRAEVITISGETIRYIQPDPDNGIFSGIPEVDAIIRDYRRLVGPLVA